MKMQQLQQAPKYQKFLKVQIDRDIEKTKDSDFGVKYELKCKIKTPDERNPCIVTVWIVENGQEEPKLITAYPAK